MEWNHVGTTKNRGRLHRVGHLADLLATKFIEVTVDGLSGAVADRVLPLGTVAERTDHRVVLQVPEQGGVDAVVAAVAGTGAHTVSIVPQRESLEEFFVREVGKSPL